jgi:hypothetical protein
MNKICSFKHSDNIISITYLKNIDINDWDKYIHQLCKISFKDEKKLWLIDCLSISKFDINLILKKIFFLQKNIHSIQKYIHISVIIVDQYLMKYISYILSYIPNNNNVLFVTNLKEGENLIKEYKYFKY